MRARTPKNTGTLKNIGKFPSLKNKSIVWFESHLERDFIYLSEFNKSVIKYREQPFKINYFRNGKLHYYTPDFLVERINKKQIIEIKPQSKTEKEEFISFSKFMTNFLANEGYEYLVITDSFIRIQPRLSNVKLLWRYARIPILLKHQVLVHKLFCNSSKFSFSEVCTFFSDKKEPKELIYSLLFAGHLLIDIDKPITADSSILMGDIN